jgi:hypothetical protein
MRVVGTLLARLSVAATTLSVHYDLPVINPTLINNRRLHNRHYWAHSLILSKEEEALIVTFRKHILLPLDDCLYAPSNALSRAEKAFRAVGTHNLERHFFGAEIVVKAGLPDRKNVG